MNPHQHQPSTGVTRHDFIDRGGSEEKVLVVVFLRGGADGLTLVPPVVDDVYQRARPFLAVDRKNTIDLDGYFALNTTLRPLMKHYESSALAIARASDLLVYLQVASAQDADS